jgi:hypothetical protein
MKYPKTDTASNKEIDECRELLYPFLHIKMEGGKTEWDFLKEDYENPF